MEVYTITGGGYEEIFYFPISTLGKDYCQQQTDELKLHQKTFWCHKKFLAATNSSLGFLLRGVLVLLRGVGWTK